MNILKINYKNNKSKRKSNKIKMINKNKFNKSRLRANFKPFLSFRKIKFCTNWIFLKMLKSNTNSRLNRALTKK